jgi:hypothetical protein
MALSTCIKCSAVNSFEVKETTPHGSRYKVWLVQCRMCGGVVGVMEYFSTHALLKKIADRLGVNLFG